MAVSVSYRKQIPYRFERVLAQYFDLEHFETVHPRTLGRCRVLEVKEGRILYEQRWPRWLGVRLRTLAEQRWVPPDRIEFRFLAGLLRGVHVSTHLQADGDGTRIEELYRVPLVPGWSWLRPAVERVVARGADRIWSEDLAVELCHGGWPGVPDRETPVSGGSAAAASVPRPGPRWVRVADLTDLVDGRLHRLNVEGQEVVVWKRGAAVGALDNRCPHAQGPLSLGWLQGETVVCPWHGARFTLTDGRACAGPTSLDVRRYDVKLAGPAVMLQLPTA